jgi:hypothetical protein
MNTWASAPWPGGPLPRLLEVIRSERGERFVLERNGYLEPALRGTTYHAERLTAAVMTAYRAPFPTSQSRLALLCWSRDIPVIETDPSYPEMKRIEESLSLFSSITILLVWGMQDPVLPPKSWVGGRAATRTRPPARSGTRAISCRKTPPTGSWAGSSNSSNARSPGRGTLRRRDASEGTPAPAKNLLETFAEAPVFTSVGEGQAWLVVLVLLSAIEGLIILFALGRLLGSRRVPAGRRISPDEALQRELAEIGTRLAALEQSMSRIADAVPRSIQGVGVVRYNPFPDMGSNMSFSLALLDGHANGVVMSVLTNREGSRVYGKAVERGSSSYPLSDEERQALALARNNRR